MKYLLIILVCFSCCGTKGTKQGSATTTENGAATVEPTPINTNKSDTSELVKTPIAAKQIAIRFGSLASGPIEETFLKTWLEKFKKDQKAGITADKFSGCGKEGEYIIVVNKSNFTDAQESSFTSGLEKLVEDEVKRTKAISPSSGSVEIINDPNIEEYSYCRLGSKKWL